MARISLAVRYSTAINSRVNNGTVAMTLIVIKIAYVDRFWLNPTAHLPELNQNECIDPFHVR